MKTFKVAVCCILIAALTAVCTLSLKNGVGEYGEADSIAGKIIETTRAEAQTETYKADDEHVRPIGRTVYSDGERWFSQSGSGIEFRCVGDYVDITLLSDNASGYTSHNPRVAVYAGDTVMFDETLTEEKTEVHIDLTMFSYSGERTIRVVKLSESSFSSVGIEKITASVKRDIAPTYGKSLKIEFIGDSITCGYGIDEESRYAEFSTATENFSKSFAYIAARELDAQYSAVAYSGYGVVSGSTSSGYINDEDVIFNKYEKALDTKSFEEEAEAESTSDTTEESTTVSSDETTSAENKKVEKKSLSDWNFDGFVPNMVVINLGANDETYCTNDERRKMFKDEYVKLIDLVKEKYPNAYVLCALGDMNQSLYSYIEQTIDEYKDKTGDDKISSVLLKFDLENNGTVIHGHPSYKANISAAKSLVSEIDKILYDSPYIYDEATDVNGEAITPSTGTYIETLDTTVPETDEDGNEVSPEDN